jgi:hypothetical protein
MTKRLTVALITLLCSASSPNAYFFFARLKILSAAEMKAVGVTLGFSTL